MYTHTHIHTHTHTHTHTYIYIHTDNGVEFLFVGFCLAKRENKNKKSQRPSISTMKSHHMEKYSIYIHYVTQCVYIFSQRHIVNIY